MIFDGWYDLVRLVIVGSAAYFSLILLLRISGKRTLSKLNAFDLVVTVSLGSILASSLLSEDVSVVEAVSAFGVLIGLQFVIAWTSVRSKTFRSLIKSEPTLLFYRGEYLSASLKDQRIAKEEIRAKVREMGLVDLKAVEAVVLETDGTFSVVTGTVQADASSLQDVRNDNASL
jgi:uncharacterized membrane protein YcaP (DUF421 family)